MIVLLHVLFLLGVVDVLAYDFGESGILAHCYFLLESSLVREGIGLFTYSLSGWRAVFIEHARALKNHIR